MKKEVKIGLLILLVGILSLSGFLSSATNEDYTSYLSIEFTEFECAIVGCDSDFSGKMVLPESINGRTVTRVGDKAFSDCDLITEVIIPDTVSEIGQEAFSKCYSLKSVIMSDSVNKIGSSAFSECESLINVQLSENLPTIPRNCFYLCKSFLDVNIPSKVRVIAENAFLGCTSLKNIVLGEAVENLSQKCFGNCSSLNSIYLPAGIEVIDKEAFENCSALSNVYYQGTDSALDTVTIGTGNDSLTKATIICNHYHELSVITKSVKPGCVTSGYYEGMCLCGIKGLKETIEAKGHTLSVVKTISEADCANVGICRYLCSGCDYFETVIMPTEPHKEVILPEVKSTCSTAGKTQGSYCELCGETLKVQTTIPKQGHDFTKKIKDSKHLASEATYSKASRYYYSCSRCSEISFEKTFSGEKLILGRVRGITFTPGSDYVSLKWNKVANARGYAVYQKNSKGEWKLLKRTRNTSYSVNGLYAGKDYVFAVKAYVVENGKVIYGPYYSSVKTATAPARPGEIYVKQSDDSITLSWNKVKNADGYRVYGYDSKRDEWKVIRKKLDKNKITIKNLESGRRYKFAVRSYTLANDKLILSRKYRTILTAVRPEIPYVKATSYKNSVKLEWDAVRYADGYMVYISQNPDSDFRRIKNTTSKSFKVNNLKSSRKYYFKVCAYRIVSGEKIYSYGQVKTVRTR